MKKLQHKFVDCMPQPLEEGILYVSIRFGIVSHSCCCGCGNEVVLNLSPDGWQFSYDGQSISLYPSIGNVNFKCGSHYWITDNKVYWAESWSDEELEELRTTRSSSAWKFSNTSFGRGELKKDKKKSFWSKIIRRRKD